MDLENIANNLQAVGFNIQGYQLKLDKWANCKLFENKAGHKSGGYIVNTRLNLCSWKNHKTMENGSFPLDRQRVGSNYDYQKAIQENQKQERDKFFANAKKASFKYNAIVEQPNAKSEYLQRKQVSNFGCKIDGSGNLVMALRSLDVKKDGTRTSYIRTLQTIFPNGTKMMESGCEKKGNMHLIGFNKIFKDPEKYTGKILVAEGYATAATLHMATGLPTVVAVDAGNLEPVMSKITKYYPNSEYTICADNDLKTEKNIGRNVGVEAAKACQEKYGCAVVIPDFTNIQDSEMLTDFNDLQVVSNLNAVTNSIIGGQELNQSHESNKFNANNVGNVIIDPITQSPLESNRISQPQVPQNIKEVIQTISDKEKFTRQMNPDGEILLTSKSNAQIQATINQKSGAIKLFVNGENAVTTNKNGVTYHPELLNQFSNSINKPLTQAKSNEDVLKQYEVKHPELINQIRKDRYIEVSGVNGGIMQLSENQPERLAELLAKTTGIEQSKSISADLPLKQEYSTSITR